MYLIQSDTTEASVGSFIGWLYLSYIISIETELYTQNKE